MPIALEQRGETVERIPIIVGQQNAMAGGPICPIRRYRARGHRGHFTVRLRPQGKTDQELTALPRTLAIRGHGAAMHLHELPHEREADSEPALRAMRGAIHLREQLE